MSKNVIKVGTHNGVFHADEVLAIALLKVKYSDKEIYITRSRDQKILDTCDILVDVGGIYDGDSKFDHHQFEKTDENYGLSSAGLVYRETEQYKKLSRLVKDVDNQDTGIQFQDEFHFCNLISAMNDTDIHSEDQNVAFSNAVLFAYKLIKSMIATEKHASRLEVIAKEATITKLSNVVFAQVSEWVPVNLFIDIADFVISYDDHQKCWSVQQVKGSKHSLTEDDSEDTVFVHKAGFIGKFKETTWNDDGQLFRNAIHMQIGSKGFTYFIGEQYY